MYQTSLFFEIAATEDKQKIIEIFFRSWIDEICMNEVSYNIQTPVADSDHFSIDFERIEDATAVKLRGIPDEFSEYIKFV